MATRIYVVTSIHEQPMTSRLVRASNVSQAVRHAAKSAFMVEVASQDTLVDLIGAGAKVEDAGEYAELQTEEN